MVDVIVGSSFTKRYPDRENPKYIVMACKFNELSSKAEILLPLKQMPFGKVFGIKDPAGRPLYLLEFAQERPSQTVR